MRPIMLRQHPLCLALQAALVLGSGSALPIHSAQAQQRVIPLAGLTGQNGFRLDGVANGDNSGYAISAAGDINGDGLGDLIIGAFGAAPNGTSSGSSYVLFGRSGVAFAATLNLSTLNGSNGFRLDGAVAGDRSGAAVSAAGDINGDGLDDLIIGADGASPNGAYSSGSSYVLFGRSGAAFAATIELSTLNGSNGFRLDGAENDRSGTAVSAAGDINGDGLDDLIIGADGAYSNGAYSGSSYVLFGRSGAAFAATLDLSTLNGSNGFRLDGAAAGDFSGGAVSAAGDVNGDGLDDLIIGAFGAVPNGVDSGSSYVVFGRSGSAFPATLDLSALNGSNGFRLDGAATYDRSGRAVSTAGDINGDGLGDLIVGAFGAVPNGVDSGSSYVVFGRSGAAFPATLNLSALNGSNGFRLDGAATYDRSGIAVAAAGDFNGDGLGDLIVGAYSASSNGAYSGSSYVVFGRSGVAFPATLNLSALDGSSGLRLDGAAEDDRSGNAVAAAGDINGDGLDDLMVGARGADPNGEDSGSSYVVFGNTSPMRAGSGIVTLPAILEDAISPGATVHSLVSGFYLDAQPLIGVGIDTPPSPLGVSWQYALSGTPTTALPAALSASNALVIGADASGVNAGTLRFTAPDFFGNAALMLRLWDGTGRAPDALNILFGSGQNIASLVGNVGGFSNDANRMQIVQPVLPVNDAPSFSASDPAPVLSDVGVVQVPGWASFTPGPANESGQTATEYQVSAISNPALFASGQAPSVTVQGSSGTLHYSPNTGTFGTSTFAVRVRDSGGTADGGIDLSPAQTFTITVTQGAPIIFRNGFE